jgi:long-subunit acyl-CoA synthetase (AMP-forming)
MTKLVMMMKNKVKWNVQRIRVMKQTAGDHVKYATLNNSELIHHLQSVNTEPLLDTTFM